MRLLLWLFFSHFLFDYPLQGPFLSEAKNKYKPIAGVPWYWCMLAHAFLHGAGVAVVTGDWFLGLLEVVCHFAIDHMKCRGLFGSDPSKAFDFDQLLHLLCKCVWFLAA